MRQYRSRIRSPRHRDHSTGQIADSFEMRTIVNGIREYEIQRFLGEKAAAPTLTYPIKNGLIDLPHYLNEGDHLEIEAFNRTLAQDRAVRYLLGQEDVGEVHQEDPEQHTDTHLDHNFDPMNEPALIKAYLIRYLSVRPEKAIYELASVLRGFEPVASSITDKLEDDESSIDVQQLDFLARYEWLGRQVERRVEKRFRTTDKFEQNERAKQNKLARQMTDPLFGKLRPHRNLPWWELDQIAIETRANNRDYTELMTRIRNARKDEQLRMKLEDIYSPAQTEPFKTALRCLLSGFVPDVQSHREAIALMDALAHRSDYLPEGQDIDGALIAKARKTARIMLSMGALVSSTDTGSGAYSVALEERQIRSLRRPRHTTGNPDQNLPSEQKGIPVVPISKE